MKKCKRIKGFRRYFITDHGILMNSSKVLNPCITKKGYLRTGLINDNGLVKQVLIHRLVALSFLPNKKKLPEVNHKNGIKTDNSVNNLEWSSSSQNQLHAYAIGLKNQYKGENHGRAKLKEIEVIEIREKYKTGNYTLSSLASIYKVGKSSIGYIVNNQTWKHQKVG